MKAIVHVWDSYTSAMDSHVVDVEEKTFEAVHVAVCKRTGEELGDWKLNRARGYEDDSRNVAVYVMNTTGVMKTISVYCCTFLDSKEP